MQKVIQRRELTGPEDFFDKQLPAVLARIYRGRGIDSPEQLDLALEKLHPPHLLLNAERAAALLADALENDSRIVVIGDFDADGATSTALLVSALRTFGARQVDYLVPNRFEYGYGLTPEIVALAARDKPDLIITVDNGISSIEGVQAAKALGIATLITDHHLAGRELPAADVIVNPNQPGCRFPSKALAGVGVIFYVMVALRALLRSRGSSRQREQVNLAQYLDLVALGTIADVVPLDHNNRILVAEGLKRIRAAQCRPGILALLEEASRDYRTVVAADLGFAVAPRINAAGRLEDMSIGIECLLMEDLNAARGQASRLQQLNQERRSIEADMQAEALNILDELRLDEASELPVAMTLYQSGWHQGVIGILASRIKDRLHRPTIAFADGDNGELKGSARSISGIHIRDILDAVATRHPGLVTRFGGHAMAAGLTLPRAAYESFAAAFVEEVGQHAQDVELQAVIASDGELSAKDLQLDLATTLRFAGPWGQHFPEPVFDGRFTVVSQRLVAEKHLKLVLSPLGSDVLLDAIAFNIDTDTWPNPSFTEVEMAYRLDVNEFRGQRSVQLVVEQLGGLPSK
ncbi:MAG: single-stranded-DNA-specific exonuclease RecJ [Halioglobus sp.]